MSDIPTPRTVADLCRAHPLLSIDSNVFIYLFEDKGELADRAGELVDALEAGAATGFLATLGLAEILAGPAGRDAAELSDRYVDELTSLENLNLVPLDVAIAREATRIRGATGLSLGDAVHLASAISLGATAFVTNDRRIRTIEGLEVVYLSDLTPAGSQDPS